MKIAFVPMVGMPSTDWVGYDIGKYLERRYKVSFLGDFNEKNTSEIIFIIKYMPDLKWIIKKKKEGVRIIYIPVDFFSDPFKIMQYSERIKLFDAVCVHNSRLGEKIKKYNDRVYFIDHHLKYQINREKKYKKEGFLLWIGHLEYLSSLIIKLEEVQLSDPVLVLSDLENIVCMRKKLEKEIAAASIPYTEEKLVDGRYIICGITVEQWTEQRQNIALEECKAAFDTKNDSFSHNLKPPTKAQKYIFNNVPFAIDRYSYSSEYFSGKGLEIPTLNEAERWLSKRFFEEIKDFRNKNRSIVGIEKISADYIRIAFEVINMTAKSTPNTMIASILDMYKYLVALKQKIISRVFSY